MLDPLRISVRLVHRSPDPCNLALFFRIIPSSLYKYPFFFLMLPLQNYHSYGKNLLDLQQKRLSTQLSVFQQALATFAKDHANEIKNNSEFRNQFTELCFSVGVDPLAASLSKSRRSKNLWSSVLNDSNDEYYNELAVKIIELCKRYREVNGGMVSVDDIYRVLTDKNSPNAIEDLTIEDIEVSVQKVNVLDPGFRIVSVGKNAKKYIRLVLKDMSSYEKAVFDICDVLGYASVSSLMANYRWKAIHAQEVLEELVSGGVLWVDDGAEERRYYDALSVGLVQGLDNPDLAVQMDI